MRCFALARKGLVCAALCLVAQSLWAQDGLNAQAAKNWAWDKVKSWTYYRSDSKGNRIYTGLKFFNLEYEEQTQQLVDRMKGSDEERRAALIVLADRPMDQWARLALRKAGKRDEVALFLYQRGFKYPDKDPFLYLEPSTRLDRPWTQGLGMHLDAGGKWRLQWIPSPVILPKSEAPDALPSAIKRAAQPGVLLHLKQLRPGLERLKQLSGEGEPGLVGTLANGTRAGFLLKHFEPWLKQAAPVLDPLADREAWIMHYGLQRDDFGPSSGTLVFLPGDLPTGTKLMMGLLTLNPLSKGARSRTVTWKDSAGRSEQVQQIRASGGVLNLASTPEGTWICDKEAPLRAILFPTVLITLAERTEWCRTALSAMRPETEISLWIAPRLGADAAFERAAIRRRLLESNQQTWPNPFVAKAAPRSGAFSLSLGAGPTEVLLNAILRPDWPDNLVDPVKPVFSQGDVLTPEQQKSYEHELQEIRTRRTNQKGLRDDLDALMANLDLRGVALYWRGWVTPPQLTAEEKAAMIEFAKLQKEDRWKASQMQKEGRANFFGGFGEPGMTPSAALTLPIKEGKRTATEEMMKKLWQRLFNGKAMNAKVGTAEMRGLQTAQAFTPCYAFVGDMVVLGSDGEAAQTVVQGLLGQAPTLADYQTMTSFGRAEMDGPVLVQQLESLLLAYLRVQQGGRSWWWGEPAPTEDEASLELASSFGPFLGALKSLGRVTLEMNLGPGGLEIRPK